MPTISQEMALHPLISLALFDNRPTSLKDSAGYKTSNGKKQIPTAAFTIHACLPVNSRNLPGVTK
jgi:hypothetical protein